MAIQRPAGAAIVGLAPLPPPSDVPGVLGTYVGQEHDWETDPDVFHAESAQLLHHLFARVLVVHRETFENAGGPPIAARLWRTPAFLPGPFAGEPQSDADASADAVLGWSGTLADDVGEFLAVDDWVDLGFQRFEVLWLRAKYLETEFKVAIAPDVQHRTDNYTNGYLSQVAFRSNASSTLEFRVGLAVANAFSLETLDLSSLV
ncbi:MAG TPA: hypothetical protein VHG32_10790 [Thermoanaerobaculia bacterium]|jgi:hypothetical protein|nr:hypothetical protein [Thermoanaerobaculia bacterium]